MSERVGLAVVASGSTLPESHDLHPVDLDGLLVRAHLLGLDRVAFRIALPRLRGTDPPRGTIPG